MSVQHMHKRRGYWYYIRRVPDHAKSVDSRRWINKTTGIRIADDPRGISARKIVAELEAELENHWGDKFASREPAYNMKKRAIHPNELSAVVKESRRTPEMKQAALALRLIVNLEAVSRIERGNATVSIDLTLHDLTTFNLSLIENSDLDE